MACVQGADTPSPAAAGSSASDATAGAEASTQPDTEEQSGRSASGTAPAEVDAFKCDCLMNARYHAAREAFLDGVHRWLMFGVIAAGTGSVIDMFTDHPSFKVAFGALAAVFGTLDLVFDLSNRARAHALMKRRYFELLADVADRKLDAAGATACMHRYSADEEPAYHALIAAAWNAAQEMVYGEQARKYIIGWKESFWKNFWRFEGTKFELEPE